MNQTKTISLKVSLEEHRRMKILAARTGRTIKDLILECLARLEREHKEE
jgi:predicted DNA-binding protein